MVTINTIGLGSVEPHVFITLRRYAYSNSLLARGETAPGESISHQISRHALLMLEQLRANSPGRKLRRKIQVEPSVNFLFNRNTRRSLRILHEYHRTDGGNRTGQKALQRAIGGMAIPPPVVCVDDQTPARPGCMSTGRFNSLI